MVELAGPRVVAIVTRAPSAGGKSRLFAALGRPPDPELLTALLLDTLEAVSGAGVDRALFVEPPQACDEVRRLAPGVDVLPQRPGPLGARMEGAMRDLFDRGAGAVALVGSDLPDLQPRVLSAAFAALADDPAQVVLGPAADGGYYLVAATAIPPIFEGIDWGTAGVLAQTLAAAAWHRRRVHLLDRMDDVDTPEDLRRVVAPQTRAWVDRHL